MSGNQNDHQWTVTSGIILRMYPIVPVYMYSLMNGMVCLDSRSKISSIIIHIYLWVFAWYILYNIYFYFVGHHVYWGGGGGLSQGKNSLPTPELTSPISEEVHDILYLKELIQCRVLDGQLMKIFHRPG